MMAVSDAALNAYIDRTKQRAGDNFVHYPRDIWVQLLEHEQQRQTEEWSKSTLGQLAQEVASLRKELSELRRQNQRLHIQVFGSTVGKAKAAGFRAPPGANDGAAVAGLRQLLVDAMGDALGEVRRELEERLAALEQRPSMPSILMSISMASAR